MSTTAAERGRRIEGAVQERVTSLLETTCMAELRRAILRLRTWLAGASSPAAVVARTSRKSFSTSTRSMFSSAGVSPFSVARLTRMKPSQICDAIAGALPPMNPIGPAIISARSPTLGCGGRVRANRANHAHPGRTGTAEARPARLRHPAAAPRGHLRARRLPLELGGAPAPGGVRRHRSEPRRDDRGCGARPRGGPDLRGDDRHAALRGRADGAGAGPRARRPEPPAGRAPRFETRPGPGGRGAAHGPRPAGRDTPSRRAGLQRPRPAGQRTGEALLVRHARPREDPGGGAVVPDEGDPRRDGHRVPRPRAGGLPGGRGRRVPGARRRGADEVAPRSGAPVV